MAWKPSEHPKKYDQRNKQITEAKKYSKERQNAATDWAGSTDTAISTMDAWLKAHRDKPKQAREAAKSLGKLFATAESNFTTYAKTVAEIMALEGQIESASDPGADKSKQKELKKLQSQHRAKDKVATGLNDLITTNFNTLKAVRDQIEACIGVKPPAL